VPAKLRKMYDEGLGSTAASISLRYICSDTECGRYLVAVFTNQAGLKAPKKDTAHLKKFKLKVAAILETIDVPLTVYAATENDHFRKPRSGMWEEMKNDRDLDVRGIDLENSYLVGDAAGREVDFSDSDRY
jgi:bifunctional polynucleotide phosphatase/kinase